ncbi:hypothetical protein QUF61_00760 [Candidatus Venteria ishoeyi]|uniref:hypothetical protein n=1 Tax=Candidatus Venteria ishoeyi TaxID=1899563 RepID=UPI0025A62077|nr:hypothetical protein [Candidatus Venteria ishoeyi]MDM8545001.1 hypothetical protein [Candidatus Venteria ishoeyi]
MLKRLRQAVVDFILLPLRFVHYAKAFLITGAIEIETPFQFQLSPQLQYQGRFKTLIQLDGDQLNILPDLIDFPPALGWQSCVQTYSEQHFAKVDRALRQLDGLGKTAARISQLFGSTSGLLSGWMFEVPENFQRLIAPLLRRLTEIHPLFADISGFLLFSLASALVAGGLYYHLLHPLLMTLIIRRIKRLWR